MLSQGGIFPILYSATIRVMAGVILLPPFTPLLAVEAPILPTYVGKNSERGRHWTGTLPPFPETNSGRGERSPDSDRSRAHIPTPSGGFSHTRTHTRTHAHTPLLDRFRSPQRPSSFVPSYAMAAGDERRQPSFWSSPTPHWRCLLRLLGVQLAPRTSHPRNPYRESATRCRGRGCEQASETRSKKQEARIKKCGGAKPRKEG
jgi:hypothetical protein